MRVIDYTIDDGRENPTRYLTWLISLVRGLSGPDGVEDAGQVLEDVGRERLRGAVDREGCGA